MSLAAAGEFWATRQVEAERELSDFVASMQLLPDITEEDEAAIDDFFAADPEALAVTSPLSSPKPGGGGMWGGRRPGQGSSHKSAEAGPSRASPAADANSRTDVADARRGHRPLANWHTAMAAGASRS